MSISNLALLCGNVGKYAAGVNPLRGQNNVQGACDMGAIPNSYSGYQKVADPEIRAKFSQAWGVELPSKPGLTSIEAMNKAATGEVRAIYIMGKPDAERSQRSPCGKSLRNLDFLVVRIFSSPRRQEWQMWFCLRPVCGKGRHLYQYRARVQRVRKAVEAQREQRRLGYPG